VTFFTWLGAIIVVGLSATVALFRKGGIYNPMSSSDNTTMPVVPSTSQNPAPSAIPLTNTQSASSSSQEANKPTLVQFLTYQWIFEGAVPTNCNPGNYKFYYGGYLPIYGEVKCSKGGFAMFPTLAQGELYATNSTKSVIKNHPELTILTYLGGDGDWVGYAPSSDKNNPTEYATFISSRLGVQNSFLMKDLVVA